MRRIFTLLTALVMVFGSTVPAHALLIDMGGGLIYDDVLDLTWLQDAGYAQTSGYDADGLMTWDPAVTWADTLSYYDTVRDYTYTDWRLPEADPSAGTGYNATNSEMGHLYYTELGNSYGDFGFTNAGLFINLQPYIYWSGMGGYGVCPRVSCFCKQKHQNGKAREISGQACKPQISAPGSSPGPRRRPANRGLSSAKGRRSAPGIHSRGSTVDTGP